MSKRLRIELIPPENVRPKVLLEIGYGLFHLSLREAQELRDMLGFAIQEAKQYDK